MNKLIFLLLIILSVTISWYVIPRNNFVTFSHDGVSFKYPNNWRKLNFTNDSDYLITLEKSNNSSFLSLTLMKIGQTNETIETIEKWIIEANKDEKVISIIKNENSIITKRTFEVKFLTFKEKSKVMICNGTIFELSITTSLTDYATYLPIINNILNSFKCSY